MFLLKVINNFINSRGATEDRTRDSCVQGKYVSHLYHSPIKFVGDDGIEPTTFCV